MSEMSEAPGRDPRDVLQAFARAMAETLSDLEDEGDAEDADMAWEERGKSIPLGDLEAEFGLV